MNEYFHWGPAQQRGAEPGTSSKKPRGHNNLKMHAGLILLVCLVVDSIIWWIRGKLHVSRETPNKSTKRNERKEWNQYSNTSLNLQQPKDNLRKTALGEEGPVPATWGTEFIEKQRDLEEKSIKARRKWTRTRTGGGKKAMLTNPKTVKAVTSPRTGIFTFGSASNKNVPKGTCTPTQSTATTRRKNHHSKGTVHIKKRTTTKKIRRQRKQLMWVLEQEHHNPTRVGPRTRYRRQPVGRTRLDNTNLPSKHMKRPKRTKRKQEPTNRGPKKGKGEKEGRREDKNKLTPQRMERPKTSPARRQPPSPAGAFAKLRSNKRYKPGD